MKSITLLLFVGVFSLSASSYSQTTKVSMSLKNKTVNDVFSEIKSQTSYLFWFDKSIVDLEKPVSVEVSNETVANVLTEVLETQGLTYKMSGDHIVISKKATNLSQTTTTNENQGKQLKGVVVDENDVPIIGASIVEKGTSNGTISDLDGNFSLVVTTPLLSVSYLGYQSKEVLVDDNTTLKIVLKEDSRLLDEVVVTALGLTKSERALNYSTAQLSTSDINQVNSGNLLNNMGGKVAGLDISGNKRNGSTRVVLRGVGEIASGSTNKPLYVIDGVPVDNSNNTSVSAFGGIDYGDALAGMNTEDIESVSVLKGPAAAALYGSKASRGAILISTKKGVSGQGIGVEFNTNTSVLTTYAGLSQYQSEYGSGQGGLAPFTQADAMKVSEDAYGARLNTGLKSIFVDGSEHDYVARYNPKDFYTTGFNTLNTLSVVGGTKAATFRFSYGNEYYKDITPKFNYMKHNLTMRMNGDLTSKLSYDFKVNFNVTDANQRPESAHGRFNPTMLLAVLPADTDLSKLEAMGKDPSTGGLMNVWDGALNPYYVLHQYKQNDQRYAGNGLASITYNLLDKIKITARQGLEMSDHMTSSIIPQGSGFSQTIAGRYDKMTRGGMSRGDSKQFIVNTDMFATYNGMYGKVGLDAMVGGNYWSSKNRNTYFDAADFVADDLYTPSNAKNQSVVYNQINKKMWGLYGSLDLSYNRLLYLTLTARNDWSSTLPQQNNSYFYPSVGGSFVFTELLPQSKILSYGKVRASWAQVGSDTSPYQLNMFYGLFPSGYPTEYGSTVYPGNISGTTLPPLNLKPMITSSTELGLDFRFLDSRIGVDVAYYDNTTKDQILRVPISYSSGFTEALMNAGSVNNYGIELTLSGRVIQSADFNWDLGLTLARNYSKVKKLYSGLDRLQMNFVEAMSVMAIEGEPYGVIYGSDYIYDSNGEIVLDENGYPTYDQSYNSYLGSAIPKVIMGITNGISYKNFNLNLTIDSRLGHKYYSKTSRWMYEHGTHINTVKGRDEFYKNGTGLDPLKLGKIQSVVAAQNTYSAGYVRMKEIALGYKVPKSFCSKLNLSQANVALVVSNPFFIWRGSNFVDPTFSLNSTVGMEGVENGAEPGIRSIGVNLNLKF